MVNRLIKASRVLMEIIDAEIFVIQGVKCGQRMHDACYVVNVSPQSGVGPLKCSAMIGILGIGANRVPFRITENQFTQRQLCIVPVDSTRALCYVTIFRYLRKGW